MRSVILSIFLATFAMSSTALWACSCAAIPCTSSPPTFEGRVINIEESGFVAELFGSYGNIVTFETSGAGSTVNKVERIRTGYGYSDCGVRYEIGKRYRVWANPPGHYGKDLPETNICTPMECN